MNDRDRLREALAMWFHVAWNHWSQTIAEEEDVSDERLERWADYWVDYEELDEDVKDYDREWADKVLDDVEWGELEL